MGTKSFVDRLWRRIGRRSRPGEADGKSAAERYWTDAFESGGITTWMAEELCRHNINELVSGSAHEWPMEWFRRKFVAEPFSLGLSLGCGDGALERDVRRKNICKEIVGIDLSEGAVNIASEQAANECLTGIRYERGDFNSFSLPKSRYDIVFFHQAMHHVSKLEHCVSEMASTLKTGGILYLDEYVGPSRTEWTDELLARATEVLNNLPKSILRGSVRRVPYPIERDDPSEAVRSSEILPLVRERFEIIHQRDYGGNLLAVLYPLVNWDALDESQARRHLSSLIEEERDLIRTTQSYYTVAVARRRD